MSDQIADEFRDKASKQFSQKLYSEALINLNKSLFAAESNYCKSLAFINRSAVYFELKLYGESLTNIFYAKNYALHENLVDELNKREEICLEKCLKLIDQKPPPEDYFKLSHSAKRKIPFIINCLKIFKTESKGRGVYAMRDLKAGDVIALEEPYSKFLKEEAKFKRCGQCVSAKKFNLRTFDCHPGESN